MCLRETGVYYVRFPLIRIETPVFVVCIVILYRLYSCTQIKFNAYRFRIMNNKITGVLNAFLVKIVNNGF